MPGRVSIRASRAAAAAAKDRDTSAAPSTRKIGRPASTRTSASAVEIPDEGPETDLRTRICLTFADAQRSTTGHRKLVIKLRKIQEYCYYEPVKPGKGTDDDFGEEDFAAEVGRCVLRILVVKKSEPVGDRLVRFLGLFLKHATESDAAIAQSGDSENTETVIETPSNRLTSHILTLLVPLLIAKDKVVRFRSTQIIAHIINTLDSVDNELFEVIRVSLLKRLRDKEASVRVQAVYGLGRLAGEEDVGGDGEDSDDEGAGGVLERLLDALQNDPSADVRRSLLINLPFTPTTLPYLLERARDLDPATRRALYSRLLPALGDFRHLSLTHREKLLRWGLRDRDELVRKATARLFRERWIEDCAGIKEAAEGQPPNQAAEPSLDALLELLERIDVTNSGVEGGIALEAMKEFWEGRPDYRDYVTFPDPFWDDLTPEKVFVVRTLNDHCCQEGASTATVSLLEDKMPEVTKYGFLLQRYINKLIEAVRASATQEEAQGQGETEQDEFVVEQLLHVALTLDYSDEIGRRKMFSLMREALTFPELPEEATKLVVEVLRMVCGATAAGESEFCAIVLEAVAEVHDTIMGDSTVQAEDDTDGDESFHSAQSELGDDAPGSKKSRKKTSQADESSEINEEKAIREIMVNMKCLHIAQCMLQNVHCDLEANVHLVTMLNNLVVPAVRSQEAPIRERGLVCLGLCCLLGKSLAEENLTLFLHCFAKGHEAVQLISLQTISDIITTHPSILAAPPTTTADEEGTEATSPYLKPLHKTLLKALKSPSLPIQSLATTVACKLMLLSLLPSPAVTTDVLKHLVLAYFDPETAGNPALRQALTYFLPVYCYSKREHCERMVEVAVPVVHALIDLQEEMDEEDEMVGLTAVGGMLVDWTDPRKIVDVQEKKWRGFDVETGKEKEKEKSVDVGTHLMLAELLLEKCLTAGTSKEEKKLYVSMLAKLFLGPTTLTPNADTLSTVSALLSEAFDSKIITDATSRNALNKTQTAISKLEALAPAARVSSTAAEDEDDVKTVVEPRDADGDITMTSRASSREPVQIKRESSEAAAEAQELERQLEFEMTRFERPDAEGTVIGDYEDDEDSEGTVVGGSRRRATTDDSLIESLLDDEDDFDTIT